MAFTFIARRRLGIWWHRIRLIARGLKTPIKSEAPIILTSSSFSKIAMRIEAWESAGSSNRMRKESRVLLVSSNGAGLGHLTRLIAIRRQLGLESMIYTLSSAYQKLGLHPADVVYFPSYGDLGMDGTVWNPLMKEHFRTVVAKFRPSVVVFDGTFIYSGVHTVCESEEVPLVWLQRGCWKKRVDEKSVQRHNAAMFCDEVIVPGDYGCDENVDLGPEITPIKVAPLTLVNRRDLLPKDAARRELGLPEDKQLFLVQLGGGVINDIEDIRDFAISCVRDLGEGWRPVLAKNPLAFVSKDVSDLTVEKFPLSRYYKAFDAAILAGGYNSVQESIQLKLPAIFIPNLETKTDDQLRRVESISEKGLGRYAVNKGEVEQAVKAMANKGTRERIVRHMDEIDSSDGASMAALAVTDIVNKNSDCASH